MNSWPADKVERWPVEKLIPYARNARTHSLAQVDQIAASIKEWGWTNPVLVAEDDTLIAGHGRVLAARKLRILGLTDPDDVPEVPAEPVSRTGDVWLLGPHRLICGD